MFFNPKTLRRQRGVTTILVIAFMGVFLLTMSAVVGYGLEQSKYGRAILGRAQALDAAEAGLEYYRWFLAHFPGNLTNGTGGAGPYNYAVNDPETGASIGNASITVTGNLQCGQIQSIDLTSRGTVTANPGFARTLSARYMQTSVSAYSFVLNSSVWAGSSLAITGTYFSNSGIRMDATNNSYVQSAVSTWDCTPSYGCSPEQTAAPGVVGSGPGFALWRYPVATINFTGMTTNLGTLKTYAQNNGGLYFAPAGGSVSNQRGWHLIFNSNGTVTVKQVTSTVAVSSYSSSHGWGIVGYDAYGYPPLYEVIGSETTGTTYTVPTGCSLIFVEDRAWIEGTVSGKVTIVAATPSDTSTTPDIYLNNNILYATNDGTSGLTAIAEGAVLIPLVAPDTMTVHGIFVATGGSFERPSYTTSYNGCPYDVDCVSSSYAPYTSRTQLTLEGTVVSNGRTGTQWIDSNNNFVSGFRNRITAYDQLQATNPPPFTPVTTTNYNFVNWREQ